MRYHILLICAVALGFYSCNERELYTEDPSVLNIVESVLINDKAASIDHLSGLIEVSLPGNTDLTKVIFKAIAPKGVILSPASGNTLDLSQPVIVTADNGTSIREYRIVSKLLPSKVVFLGDGSIIDEIQDDDVKEAAKWTQQTYGNDFEYISFSALTDEALNGVNVLFYLYDEVGFTKQPSVLLEKLNVISKFYVNGGKIVAGQHGTGLVEELGRDVSGLRTIVGTGAGGQNPDVWSIGFTNSPTANIMLTGVEKNVAGAINVIDGGYKEDHNAMWTLDPIDAPKYANFSSKYAAEVLATWDWNVASEGSGGIILWNPTGRFKGSIITMGIGGMEWSMNDGRNNQFAQNIRGIYKNAIDYLKSL